MSPSALDQFSVLPALKGLGDLADVRPTIIIDTREQTPLAFSRLASVRGTLQTGDYSFAGGEELFSVERKSIPHLVACCAGERERFERELHRLRGYRFKRLLVVGSEAEIRTGGFHGGMNPKAILSSVSAFEVRYDVPAVWAGTPEAAAILIEKWAYWFSRELVQQANELLRGAKAQAQETGTNN